MSIKSLNILGVTGSIGQAAADVIASAPERFEVQVVTAHRNAAKLAEMAIRLKAKTVVIADESRYAPLKDILHNANLKEGYKPAVMAGREALIEAAAMPADLTLAAMTGMAGLRPVLKAVQNSKTVAIANKEPLVAAGPVILAEAKKHGTTILPVDSEHNAIFQVFDEKNKNHIEKIILTASGGPFRTWTKEQMQQATVEQALSHPNWAMGRKISIDSATMMNKALEVIEAHYLFAMPPATIEVLVHPQSIIHSMVEYADGSVLAQMAASDMRTPLSHVLAWPERMATPGQRLDLTKMKELTFEKPDFQRFPALQLAYEALKEGKWACIALNAANEIMVENFLDKKLSFPDIINGIGGVLEKTAGQALATLEEIEDFDRAVRIVARDYISRVIS